MAWNLVQATSATMNASSGSLAYGSNVTGGNLLAVAFADETSANGSLSSISDTRSSSWQPGVWQNAGTNRKTTVGIEWAIAASSGANTVSYTFNESLTALFLAEFSGAPAGLTVDTSGAGDFAASTSVNLPSVTTNYANSLLLYIVDAANTVTVSSPWTQATADIGDPFAYYAPGAAGAYTPAGSQSLAGVYAIAVLALGTAPVITSFVPSRMPLGA